MPINFVKKLWKNGNDPTLVVGVDPETQASEFNRIETGIKDTSDLANTNEAGLAATSVLANTNQAGLAAHLADTLDAHDASAISVLDAAGYFASLNVEDALAELFSAAVRPGGPTVVVPKIAVPSPADIVTTFQAGHGWTSSGSGTVTLNDAGVFVVGSQSLKGLTDGVGGGLTVRRTGLPAFNATGKIPVVIFRVDDWTNLSAISLYMGDTAFTNFFVHTYTDSLAAQPTQDGMLIRDGEWGVLTLPWGVKTTATGAPNRAALTDFQVRAVDKNGVPITVHWNAVYFIPEQSLFPNGVVSLVFDDGWSSQFTEARKKMDQYLFPGTAYVIASQQINNVNGYMTLQQLHDLETLNGWQISAHAYATAFHDNWTANGPPSPATVDADMASLKSWMRAEGFKGTDHFAYPGGVTNAAVEKVIKQYFASARLINASTHETLAPWNPHRLRVGQYVTSASTTAAIQAQIDLAFTNKTWLILSFHKIVTTPGASTEFSIANFGTIMDYLNTKGIPVRTVRNVLELL